MQQLVYPVTAFRTSWICAPGRARHFSQSQARNGLARMLCGCRRARAGFCESERGAAVCLPRPQQLRDSSSLKRPICAAHNQAHTTMSACVLPRSAKQSGGLQQGTELSRVFTHSTNHDTHGGNNARLERHSRNILCLALESQERDDLICLYPHAAAHNGLGHGSCSLQVREPLIVTSSVRRDTDFSVRPRLCQ